MSYDDFRFRNGSIAWEYASFERQASILLDFALGPAPLRVEYLKLQQELIEADVNCDFRFNPKVPAPYLHMHVKDSCCTVKAKAVIFNGELVGCFIRSVDKAQERFRLSGSLELATLLKNEAQYPSFNLCTIIGAFD